MFERLQQKWKVSGLRLVLILFTFAIGGSVTGYIARKIINFLVPDKGWLWILVYILLITLIWPLAVIIVSIPMGQFDFFSKYVIRLGRKMGFLSKKQQLSPQNEATIPATGGERGTIRLAIFASGAGSNAQKIIDYFRQHPAISIALVVSNKPGAGVLAIAEKEAIPTLVIEKDRFYNGDAYLSYLQQQGISFIVLAGFLWKIPSQLIKAYPQGIINIHPALLPAHGGQGMYGHRVHEAVIAAGDKESGITIHYVDEIYDHGQIIFQASCPVLPGDTPITLAGKIHRLEHEHFPPVIEQMLVK
jgi:formyltetrahydrofolate-dependent phosphoribosylglycinamide formyltransferase